MDSLEKNLLQLIDIYSPSGNEQDVSVFVQSRLAALDIAYQHDAMGNIYACVPGAGEPILLTAHLDTVHNGIEPRAVRVGDVIQSANGGILGLDDKASIAIIIDVIGQLQQSNAPHRAIEFLFTVQEEPGCYGAAYVMSHNDFFVKSRVGLSFDLPHPPGAILQSSAGIWRGEICWEGKSAHAARPHLGHNALAGAAYITQTVLQRNTHEGITANISQLQSGGPEQYNMIPAHAVMDVELRSLHDIEKEIDHLHESIALAKKQYHVDAQVHAACALQAYHHASDDVWIASIQRSMQRVGIQPHFIPFSMGGSDANIFQEHGINVAVLGNGVMGTHSADEQVRMQNLTTTRNFVLSFVTTTPMT